MSELKNLFKGTLTFIVVCILTLIGLYFLAFEMSAGTAGFNLSTKFFIAQSIAIILCYIAWYFKVNRKAANMMTIEKMRKMASRLKIHYMAISVVLSLLIGAAAVIFMIVDFFSIGIPAIYCYGSTIAMITIGNLALILLMTFVLPNRITGSY